MAYTLNDLPETTNVGALIPIYDRREIEAVLSKNYNMHVEDLSYNDTSWKLFAGLILLKNEEDGTSVPSMLNFSDIEDYINSMVITYGHELIFNAVGDDTEEQTFTELQEFLPVTNELKHNFILTLFYEHHQGINLGEEQRFLSRLTTEQKNVYVKILKELNVDNVDEYASTMFGWEFVPFTPNIGASYVEILKVLLEYADSSTLKLYDFPNNMLEELEPSAYHEWLEEKLKNNSKVLAYHIEPGDIENTVAIFKN